MLLSYRPLRTAALLTCLLTAAGAASAAAQYVAVGSQLPRFGLLKEGSHRYLRFIRTADSNTPIDIWQRDIRFENGRMQIRQRWDAIAPVPSVKQIDSSFEIGTFRPLTHERVTTKEGKRVVEGFTFAPTRITGLPNLAENTQKDIAVTSPEGTFNFETDIELLQALPLAMGYEAEINFYHPGSGAPSRYTFKVVGSELVAGPAGPVDCWLLTTDYNKAGYIAKFWFAKGSQLMVRNEGLMQDGRLLVKTLID
ncbi:hypothetical protein [Massilia sp. BJB1822]|uniref:DUF3108 domain-containing protein n=1 Tax=Massilia sp. BJB1822 TaxID=2744470 RepID=UPI001593603A|nr:hypothetical protein [Massilia sp. BJB1822]NVE01067.1 hypothetical protein [Massilia sp. BJB1822]